MMIQEKRRYTQQEDELIFNNYYDVNKRNELLKTLDRTDKAISFRFYRRILPKRGMTPQEYTKLMSSKKPTSQEEHVNSKPGAEEEPILKVLQEFPSDIKSLRDRMCKIEDRMDQLQRSVDFYLKEFSTGVINIARNMEVRESSLTEYERMSEENNKLQEKIKRIQSDYDWQISEMNRVYSEIDFWLGRFMKLSSVDKVASLADFLPKMRATFDQFGTLIKMSEDIQ